MEIMYLLSVLEGIAGHGNKDGLLGVEDSAGRVHSETLHVGRLEGPSDTASGRVDHLKKRGVTVGWSTVGQTTVIQRRDG